MPTVWQISSGPRSGPYAETFIRYGVGLVGPGDTGTWLPGKKLSSCYHLRAFAEEVQRGDVLLLRSGQYDVQAIGIVASGYQYLSQFDDVNGWDLQHARRARWCQLPETQAFDNPVFTGPPFGKVVLPEVITWAERFVNSPPTDWQTAPLPTLPPEEADLGEVPPALSDLVALAEDLAGNLYWDEQAFGARPRENEMIAHFVVPFLRALGWAQELIALEWQYVDVAVFSHLPRSADNCQLVVEAKQLGVGLDAAAEQAKAYVGRTGAYCDVLVTNGIRYRLHCRDQGYAPVAYANLCRLKTPATELFDRLRKP